MDTEVFHEDCFRQKAAQKSIAIMALEQKISDWEQDKQQAEARLASQEQSVRHSKNIISVADQVISELRAAIAMLGSLNGSEH